MATSQRKQRELAQREQLILDTAQQLLLEVGYLELSMEQIATRIEYSKGTIYQHFSSKEEILVALLIQSTLKSEQFFRRGATFSGCSRERIMAIAVGYELFVQLNPHHFKTELLVLHESIRGKASPTYRRELEAAERRSMSIVSGVIREGMAHGDFQEVPGISPEDLTFGLWTGAFGAFLLMGSEVPLATMGIKDARGAMWHNISALMDGFGWEPLGTKWDYEKTKLRINKEVFPQESSMVWGR